MDVNINLVTLVVGRFYLLPFLVTLLHLSGPLHHLTFLRHSSKLFMDFGGFLALQSIIIIGVLLFKGLLDL